MIRKDNKDNNEVLNIFMDILVDNDFKCSGTTSISAPQHSSKSFLVWYVKQGFNIRSIHIAVG